MAILYKYMSFVDDFLISPAIKLSPPNLLNDPFESHGVDDIKSVMYDSYMSDGGKPLISNGKELSQDATKKIIQNNPTNIVSRTGVLSLSESNRSLLMWAHYASQHKGIVVGFEDDFLAHVEIDDTAKKKMIHTPFPIKISYDTSRFDLLEFKTSGKNIQEIAKSLAIKLLTTKSDDWIYEKEHRYIAPIGIADHIKYLGGNNDRTNAIRKLISDGKIKIDRKTKVVSIREDIKMDSGAYLTMAKDGNFLFLKTINPEKIKSIFFGLRTPYEHIKKYVMDIENNIDTLGHIELYQYELCNTQFRLNKNTLNKSKYLK